MGKPKQIDEQPDSLAAPEPPAGPLAAARQRRKAALSAAEGLWKDRTDLPKDGVEAQERLRTEWR